MQKLLSAIAAICRYPLRWVARSEFTAPGGYREIWHIAYPLILMSASFTAMQIADRIFLAWNSTLELSAAPVAGIFYFGLSCFAIVTINFTSAVVAQLFGAEDRRGCVEASWSGLFAGLTVGLVMWLTVPFIGCWLIDHAFGHGPELTALEKTYFLALAPCGLLQCMSAPLFAFFSGRGKTLVVAAVNVIACIVNIGLDYVLIFGKWGFPAMGIKGAGIATTLSVFAGFLMILGFFLFHPQGEYATRRWICFKFEYVRKLLVFGAPSGLQVFFGVMSFNVVLVVIGRLSPEALAASNIALSINNIVFMPLLGISDATAIMVGQLVGSSRRKMANLSAYRSWRIALAYMTVCALVYVIFPEYLAAMFAPTDGSADAEQFGAVSEMACKLLVLAAVFGYCDATIQTFCGALRGAGDTMAVFIISSSCTVFIQATGVVVLGIYHAPVDVIWLFLTVYLAVEALAVTWRFRSGAWRRIHLIAGHEKPVPPGEIAG